MQVRCVLGDEMEDLQRDLERTTAIDDDLPMATPKSRTKLQHVSRTTVHRVKLYILYTVVLCTISDCQ